MQTLQITGIEKAFETESIAMHLCKHIVCSRPVCAYAKLHIMYIWIQQVIVILLYDICTFHTFMPYLKIVCHVEFCQYKDACS